MDLGPTKTPAEIIKEGTFGRTYFRDIYSGINGKWHRKLQKQFDELRNIVQKYYCSNYYDSTVNKYCDKCGTLLNFFENKRWINFIGPYGWFQWYFRYWLSRKSLDAKRQIARWKGIVSRFKGNFIKIIKDTNRRFEDHSI